MKEKGTGMDSLTMKLAEVKAEALYKEWLAAAGVNAGRLAEAMSFYVPPEFRDAYEALWWAALSGADGGSDARGRASLEAGRVGRAQRTDGGGSRAEKGRRRGYKGHWFVRDERALELKSRIDKRLRRLAKDIREEMAELGSRDKGEEERNGGGGMGERKGRDWVARRCGGCGIIASLDWRFCPKCGRLVGAGAEDE